jgi:hypothetical protein
MVNLHGGDRLRVERLLRVPDRSSVGSAHHPYSSSVEPEQAVFYGADVFLGLAGQALLEGATTVLRFELPPAWLCQTPWGSGEEYLLEDLRALRHAFWMTGADLTFSSRTIGDCAFTVAGPAALAERLRPDPFESVLDLAERAVARFGPLPGPRRLILLKPLEHTDHLRTLSVRGANASLSLLAHVDPRPTDSYQEHPLAVAAHELTHWWLPGRLPAHLRDLPSWIVEGLPTFYENRLLCDAGLIDRTEFLQAVLDARFLSRGSLPDGPTVTLEQASRNFERHTLAMNLVYRRGCVLAFALDLLLREQSDGARGIDAFVGGLLRDEPEQGAEALDRVYAILAHLGGQEAVARTIEWIRSPLPVGIRPVLATLGYEVEDRRLPYLGIQLAPLARPTVSSIAEEAPCGELLQEGDELLSLSGVGFDDAAGFRAAFARLTAGAEVDVVLRRGGEAQTLKVPLGTRVAPTVLPVERPEAEQLERRRWLERPAGSAPLREDPGGER